MSPDYEGYLDAYWRTIAYTESLELSPEIDPDGPHVDFEGGLVPNPQRAEATPA